MPSSASVSFGSLKLDFLGHMESGDGISIDPDKTKAVMDWPRPTIVIEI